MKTRYKRLAIHLLVYLIMYCVARFIFERIGFEYQSFSFWLGAGCILWLDLSWMILEELIPDKK